MLNYTIDPWFCKPVVFSFKNKIREINSLIFNIVKTALELYKTYLPPGGTIIYDLSFSGLPGVIKVFNNLFN